MKHSSSVLKTLCFLLITGFIAVSSLTVFASEQSILLSQNGLEVIIKLPPESRVDSQIFPDHAIVYLDEVQVVMEIMDTTVEKQIDFERHIYESFMKDSPTTTYFEELPKITTDMGDFTVCKLTYNDHNDNQATSLQAFCKINHRYIYSITLSKVGDIDADLIRNFSSGTVTKTPYEFDLTMTLFVIAYAALGLFIILNSFRKKHFRVRTTGVITGFHSMRRSVNIQISYFLENGQKMTGEHNTIIVGMIQFAKMKGQEVEISYSEKSPRNVHILSSKTEYITGLIFLILAVLFVYLMVFQL